MVFLVPGWVLIVRKVDNSVTYEFAATTMKRPASDLQNDTSSSPSKRRVISDEDVFKSFRVGLLEAANRSKYQMQYAESSP